MCIPSVRRWSPKDPVLYDIRLTVGSDGDGNDADVVETTIGFRTIGFAPTTEDGPRWLHINDEPVYVRAVMAQGYHPGGYLAYPDEPTIRADLEMARRLGFNMVRSHVKVEDPGSWHGRTDWASCCGRKCPIS